MSVVANLGTEVKSLIIEGNFANRKVAEITIAQTGEKMIYRCSQRDRFKAQKEVNKIIRALEKESGRIIWKFKDESTIHLGAIKTESFSSKAKKAILEFLEWD